MSRPEKKSYRNARKSFENGTSGPSNFLEECLKTIDEVEEKIAAFVATDIDGAKVAARESDKRWREGTPLSLIDGISKAINGSVLIVKVSISKIISSPFL